MAAALESRSSSDIIAHKDAIKNDLDAIFSKRLVSWGLQANYFELSIAKEIETEKTTKKP